jgi:DNA-binding transcriptional LysR family regulator
MMNDLEREWGIVLFNRARNKLQLTEEAKVILPYIQRISREEEQLHQQIQALKNIEVGTIRIGTFSSVATHWLPHMIKRFKESYPLVEFELLLGDYIEIEHWIAEGIVDFGFLSGEQTLPLEKIFVEQDRLLAVIPKNHLYACEAVFPMKALAESPFMLLEKGESDVISAIFEEHHIQPMVQFKTWDDYAIMSMVENELGISILPELILKRMPYNVTIMELEQPAFRSIYIGMKQQKTLSIAAEKFLGYVKYRHGGQ